MKSAKIFFIFVSSILLNSAIAFGGDIFVYDAKCSDDGSLIIYMDALSGSKSVSTKNISITATYSGYTIPVNGGWNVDKISEGADKASEMATFKTSEAVFNDSGNYLLDISYYIDNVLKVINHGVECPGFVFSCKLLNIKIENCSTKDDNLFEAKFFVHGLNQSKISVLDLYKDLEFSIKAAFRYTDIRGEYSTTGSLPKGFVLDVEGANKYSIKSNMFNNTIESFGVRFKEREECKGKYPELELEDYAECISIFSPEIEDVVEKDIIEKEVETENNVEDVATDEIPIKKVVLKEEGDNYSLFVILAVVVFVICAILFILKKQKANKWV